MFLFLSLIQPLLLQVTGNQSMVMKIHGQQQGDGLRQLLSISKDFTLVEPIKDLIPYGDPKLLITLTLILELH